MSNRLLTAAWSARGLTSTEKLILLKLADHADSHGISFPGHKFIAEECGLSERCVRDTLQLLQGKRHIAIRQDSTRAKKGQPKFTYLVHPLTPESSSSVTREPHSAVTGENGASDTGRSQRGHGKITTPTGENGAQPYITCTNRNINHQGNQPIVELRLSSSERISAEKELDEIKEQRARIRNSYDENVTWPKQDRDFYNRLGARRRQLKALLGRVI